jgi:hypothetical protein
MSAPIVVINPNSTVAVTDAIDEAVAPLRMAGGPAIVCVTLAEGPPGIETQAHVEQVVQPISRLIRAREHDAAAFVIACFSDPGLHLARLGMGGGYYDRWLARPRAARRPLRVGFGFALQEARVVPATAHDVRLDAVVTERGLRRFR